MRISAFATTLAIGLAAATQALAAPIFTSDRADFELNNPGLATEDFETGFVTDDGIPSASNNGITYTSIGSGINEVIIVEPGSFGTSSSTNVILANGFGDSLILTFDTAVTAFGGDFLSEFSGSDITVSLFDELDNLLASSVVTTTGAGDANGAFLGFTSTNTAVSSISILGTSSSSGVDNLLFGQATTDVPAPGMLGLLGLGLAALGMRRRHA